MPLRKSRIWPAMRTPAVQHCFPPVVRPDTRLLLLGSLPGTVSLARGQYYAHRRNQFWRLVGALIRADLPALPYSVRLEQLQEAGIGLWDTVAAATRRGSLDTDIRLRTASDLPALVASLPALRAIGFNGATSARIGRRALGNPGELALVDLPSSSPAFTLSFEAKLEAWRALSPFL